MKNLSVKNLKKSTRRICGFSGTKNQFGDTTTGTDTTTATITVTTSTHLLG